MTLNQAGTSLLLYNKTGGAADNVHRVYGLADLPDGPEGTDVFDGFTADGQWTLAVTDMVAGDVGSLDDWRLFW